MFLPRVPTSHQAHYIDKLPLASLKHHRQEHWEGPSVAPSILGDRQMWCSYRCRWLSRAVGLIEDDPSKAPLSAHSDWIATVPSWPENFEYRPMKETALELSNELRDSKGEHRVEIIIALTHCRVPNVSTTVNMGAVCPRYNI